MRKFLAITVLAVSMAGCAQLGIQTTTPQDKEYGAVQLITNIEASTTTLLKSGAITKQDAQNVETSRNVAVQGLAIARAMNQASPGSGTAKIDAVIASLTALQAYLLTRTGAK